MSPHPQSREGFEFPTLTQPNLPRKGQALSRILLEDQVLSGRQMLDAMVEADRLNQPLEQVLQCEGLVAPDRIMQALSQKHGAPILRRASTPPDPKALARLTATFCLEEGVLPWRFVGETLVLATAQPSRFEAIKAKLPDDCGPVAMAIALDEEIRAILAENHGASIANQAEMDRPAALSCRDINQSSPYGLLLGATLATAFCLMLAFAPNILFAAALVTALVSVAVAQGIKILAMAALPRKMVPEPIQLPEKPPRVTLLVPLFKEERVAEVLLARLGKLLYPKSLLEVLLILEEEDITTARTLNALSLPPWVKVISVPSGAIQTKPRALNYAMRFATGEIIGIFDAEDDPAPDQINRVVSQFAKRPARVACLQGILDFYNPKANWLSRCFAIEYASWFRLVLPGLARAGMPVLLGGTTVFFRRAALRAVNNWDAHNVTEDADIGILLARKGFVTEILPTVTREEANNRLWPWIRQRSRWLKGYIITWWVHSRRPLRLWRDLGTSRFIGMQALLVSTILQFTLAPVLWSFWLVLMGLPHPMDGLLSPETLRMLIAFFLGTEAISLLVGLVALARSPYPRLMPWVPSLLLYFPLGTLAIYKALWELLRRPFYWDKTQHGLSGPDIDTPENPNHAA